MLVFYRLAPGVYRRPDGEIYRMQLARSGRSMYASRWTERGNRWAWEYDSAEESTLTIDMLLPLDEAREISRAVGQCLACAALLTDPQSQARGIGPTCAKRWDRDRVRAGYVFGASREQIDEARERERAAYAAARAEEARASVRAGVRDDGASVWISSRYDDRIVSVIRTTPGAHWDGSRWIVPRSEALGLAEAFALAGIAHDDLAAIGVGWLA